MPSKPTNASKAPKKKKIKKIRKNKSTIGSKKDEHFDFFERKSDLIDSVDCFELEDFGKFPSIVSTRVISGTKKDGNRLSDNEIAFINEHCQNLIAQRDPL